MLCMSDWLSAATNVLPDSTIGTSQMKQRLVQRSHLEHVCAQAMRGLSNG